MVGEDKGRLADKNHPKEKHSAGVALDTIEPVTTGQAKMMQRASGTGMKLTLARLLMKEKAPITPKHIKFEKHLYK